MYPSPQEARQRPCRALDRLPFCAGHWLGGEDISGRLVGGGGEIGSQIIEFFELEAPWKVEKGPGGHERKKDHLA